MVIEIGIKDPGSRSSIYFTAMAMFFFFYVCNACTVRVMYNRGLMCNAYMCGAIIIVMYVGVQCSSWGGGGCVHGASDALTLCCMCFKRRSSLLENQNLE